HVVFPSCVLVVQHGGAEAPRRVDARAGDRNRRQVHDEHREPDRQRHEYGDEGVAGGALGVGGGEDGVDEDERADDLGAEGAGGGVAVADGVGAAAERVVGALHDPLDDAGAGDGAEALRHDVQHGADERQLPPEEEAQRHRRVDVPAGDAAGAVDEDEYGGTERPRHAEVADAGARVDGGPLVLVPDHGGDAHVEEDERRHELRDEGTVQRPLTQLARVQQRRRRRVPVRRLRRRRSALHRLHGHLLLRRH
ncbi:Os09g0541050, partial [Oryza sativa Japonica Group]